MQLCLAQAGAVTPLLFSALSPPGRATIDLANLDSLLAVDSEDRLRQRLTWLFRMFDRDGSATLTLAEMVEVFSSLYITEGLDQDAAVDRAEEIFSALDEDLDGEVSCEEFVRGCLEDRQLVAEMLGGEEEEEALGVRGSQSVEGRNTTKNRYFNICRYRCHKCTYAGKSGDGLESHMNKKHVED